jgi:hypothetical protein
MSHKSGAEQGKAISDQNTKDQSRTDQDKQETTLIDTLEHSNLEADPAAMRKTGGEARVIRYHSPTAEQNEAGIWSL